jgi:dTDP-4-dehydrorhamnose reductase
VSGDAPARLAQPVLLFGGTGQVGRELQPALDGIATVVVPRRDDADLARPDMLYDAIRSVRPSVIINAAALTNVDRAEREPDLAHRLNAVAPGVIADAAREVGALLVHYSTDYVFDGERDVPYDETDEPNPINVYGATKLSGERNIAAAGTPHLIIRTSWVYSRDGSGFVATLIRQLRDSAELRVVADQTGSPTWSRALALATVGILRQLIHQSAVRLPDERRGVYHLAGSGSASRIDIARELVAAVAESTTGSARQPAITPIRASEFGAVAPRPRYSALANDRAFRDFGVALDPWPVLLRRMLADWHA